MSLPQSQDDTQKPITVAIADDHKMLREYVVKNINSLKGFKVVVEADNGKLLIEALAGLRELPRVCIIDISMPVMNGYETQLIIRKRWPHVKSLAISIYDNRECIVQMLQNGADGFISKNSSAAVMEEALHALCNEGYYYGQIPDDVVKEVREWRSGEEIQSGGRERRAKKHNEEREDRGAAGKSPELTEREKEYLTLTCAGRTLDEIAVDLGISARTVEHYRDNVHRKLNVSNKADLLFYVMRTGIVFMK